MRGSCTQGFSAYVERVVEGMNIEELDATQKTNTAQMAASEAKIVEHWQEVTELIRVGKAKKLLVQNYSTYDNALPLFYDMMDADSESHPPLMKNVLQAQPDLLQ